jgi:hypothetical protein
LKEIGDSRIKIYEIKMQSSADYKDLIDKEAIQLPDFCPGIIALYLDQSITNERDISKAFFDARAWMINKTTAIIEPGESAADNSTISALLIYKRWYNRKYTIHKKIYLNPRARNPLSMNIMTRFEEFGLEIDADSMLAEESDIETLKDIYRKNKKYVKANIIIDKK